ncbi:2,3-bisphosphoglycerate-dependent phosphoglycerate mutase [Planktothrix tepida]|uniref:phosphoglycerate mutase (2,3-diphosphoglycerate-dependent) n=2 Tax=Planktothrix TaxID=54304 RepID=A0A1J1LDJ3_9CYAN|nr:MULTISPECIES: histidine phosphatase family protein [Planktothrix]CAD5916950.1 2,3-bisphosphoglycerate-dependent phosphoglycerate mutase [Planktothrix tepida]CAD5985374.1 2,3-bisphosphoglycerate-dependent phosphoglycerate mutase [Planktothrix pseudagardhii]CUR30699.1 Putative Phosphoglycerate mutase (modular protein) [Planktothrix tepida PCC 9214]
MVEKISNSQSPPSTSNQVREDNIGKRESLLGNVYFVRHGESTSNERNIFAGVLDVELTSFGKLQARRAGVDIKKQGVKFDAVYVSHMKRARQTCEIALAESQALKSPDIPVEIDHRISEKSFGIFAGRNLNLLRLALGYEGFEEMLHSHNEAPPAGEKIAQVYDRAARFYEEKVVPHLEQGETVLVVCHQYVLEPLALYLSGLPPTAYKHLKLPNGKALSGEDLVKFRDKESGGAAALRKEINDLSIMWAILIYAVAFLLGTLVRAISASPAAIQSDIFRAIIVACLAASTFYTYLDIDFAASKRKVTSTVQYIVYGWTIARWVVGLFLIFSGGLYQSPEDLYKVMWVLFWMVPPALTSPILSVLWGGNLYPSAVLSKNLSIIAPLALIGTFTIAKQLPINSSSLSFFFIILIVGLAIPGALAQFWRDKSPVESNHHSKNWKFIGVLAVALMALVTGFQFTPATFISDLFTATDPMRSFACLQQLALAVLIFVSMRGLAVLTAVFSKGKLNKAEAQDAYILLVNPNFYLWAVLFLGISTTANPEAVRYAIFWTSLGFFCIPLIEQILFMNAFGNDILRETLRSSRMATENVKKLFLKLDTDGSKTLDRAEIMELLGLIEDMTSGTRSSEEVRKYITDYLFNILDADKNGTIDLQELEDYISTYGLVANLNVAPATASPT